MSIDGSGLGVVQHRYVELLRVSGSVGGESLNFLMLRRRRSVFDRRGEDVFLRMRRGEGDARVGVGEERRVGRRVGNVSTRSRGNVSLIRWSSNGEMVRCCSFPSSSTLTLISELWNDRFGSSAFREEQRDNLSKIRRLTQVRICEFDIDSVSIVFDIDLVRKEYSPASY